MASIAEIRARLKPITALEVEQILADNFEEIWDSEGAAIGSDWKGRDLYQTGTLYNTLVSGGFTRTTLPYGFSVTVGQPYTYVAAEYPFLGLTVLSKRRLMNRLLGGV